MRVTSASQRVNANDFWLSAWGFDALDALIWCSECGVGMSWVDWGYDIVDDS